MTAVRTAFRPASRRAATVAHAPGRQLSLLQQALSAIRRLNGTALYVPDDYGLVLGPELVTNGDFSAGTTGWTNYYTTMSASGGELTVTGGIDLYSQVWQYIPVSAGKSYIVSVDSKIGTAANVKIAYDIGAGDVVQATVTTSSYTTTRFRVQAVGSTLQMNLRLGNQNGLTGFYRGVSVREILSATTFIDSTGTQPVTAVGDLVGKLNDSAGSNHATQGTTASKPLVTQLANGRKAMTFDGSNDFLVTGNPSITNACTIVMAYTQTGADGLFVMTGQNANGAELVKSGNVVYFSKAGAGTIVSAPAGSFPQSVPHVLTARIDASGNAVIRKNGAVVASATVPTTFTATSGMGIAAQAGSSFPFPAQIQSYVLTNTAIPDADLKTIERWMAQQIWVTYVG